MENHDLRPREDDPGYWDGLERGEECPVCGADEPRFCDQWKHWIAESEAESDARNVEPDTGLIDREED
jgi:hypothetical protein